MTKKEQKVIRISVLLSASHYEAIKAAADAIGLDVSAFVRQAALKASQ